MVALLVLGPELVEIAALEVPMEDSRATAEDIVAVGIAVEDIVVKDIAMEEIATEDSLGVAPCVVDVLLAVPLRVVLLAVAPLAAAEYLEAVVVARHPPDSLLLLPDSLLLLPVSSQQLQDPRYKQK